MTRSIAGAPLVLRGAPVADVVLGAAAGDVQRLVDAGEHRPCLATVLVGQDPASGAYVASKLRAAERVGVEARFVPLPHAVTTVEVTDTVSSLAAEHTVTGILVQLPLPGHVDSAAVIDCVPVAKDVDGLTPASLGRLVAGRPGHRPATPSGVLALLAHYGIALAGRRLLVIGRSTLVGRPLALMASAPGVDATVTVAHSASVDLPALCREADVVVSAAGVPGLLQPGFCSPGAVVVDVGFTATDQGWQGDLHRDAIGGLAAYSPVPGGVGPLTVAFVVHNTVTGMAQR